MNYTGGSLCPSKSSRDRRAPIDLSAREIIHDDDDDEDKDKDKDKEDKDKKKGKDDEDEDSKKKKKPSSDGERRKTAIISLLCESDPLAKTAFSFVAAVDDCVYFFEGRSPAACGGIHVEKQALSPGGVFGVIMLIAVLVYLVGGCVYQRTVMHQRGWRQLPNYAMWAGIARFIAVSPPGPSSAPTKANISRTCSSFLPHPARVSCPPDEATAASRSDRNVAVAAGAAATKTG